MGAVEGIFLVGAKGAEREAVERVRVVAGRGPAGDRHFRAPHARLNEEGMGRDLTLIEAEALEGLEAEHGIALSPEAAGRNVVTRGVDLNALVGRRFMVGEVECLGQRLCDPCSHLERSTMPGVLKGLANRGGLRADILRGGWFAVGAEIHELDD